jgi:hypothetical protein
MGDFSAAATAAAFAPAPGLTSEYDLLSRLAPPEGCDTTQRFRFVPPTCLVNCNTEWDSGIDCVVYLQSFIEEE